jgi:hypothetical protein
MVHWIVREAIEASVRCGCRWIMSPIGEQTARYVLEDAIDPIVSGTRVVQLP